MQSDILWGFNYDWDHVRVLMKPKSSGLHDAAARLICHSFSSAASFSFRDPAEKAYNVYEKIFTQELRQATGQWDPITAIEVTYHGLASDPAGLTFLYQHGEPRVLGYRGKRPEVHKLNIEEGEELVLFAVGIIRGSRIAYLEVSSIPQPCREMNPKLTLFFSFSQFTTNLGQTFKFTGNTGGDKVQPNKRVHSRVVFPLVRSWPGSDAVKNVDPSGTLVSIPETAGRFVGFWAVPKRGVRFPMMGPIFESNDP